MQVWVNTCLGETWEDRGGDMIDPGGLLARRETFGDELPADVVLLTAGVDVQADRIEAQVVGWGAGEQSFVLEHHVIWGDPSGPAIWEDLDAFLLERRPHARAVPDMGLRAVAVDTGGSNTAMAYEFTRTRLRRRVWGIKGRGGQGVQAWPRTASKGKGGAPVFIVGVDALKDKIAARLPIAEPGPGAIRFAAGLGPEWFDQLTAEKVRTRYVNGRPVRSWEPKRSGIRNEALDCLVYASAALHGLRVQGLDLEREAQELANVALKAAGRVALAPAARPTRIKSKWMER